MMSSSTVKKRKLLEYYEETSDDPCNDIKYANEIISKGIDLVLRGFARIQSGTQDELTRLAMDKKQTCIKQLNQLKQDVKVIAEQKLKEITDLMDESRLRADEIKLYDFHEDILLILFEYLPLKQILNLRAISKRMHQVITTLISKRVTWIIDLSADYKFSLSQFSASTPLHLHLHLFKDLESGNDNVYDLQTNCHRFYFSSVIDLGYGKMDCLPEQVCENMTSVETLKSTYAKEKQTSIIINASSGTLHKLELASVTLHSALVKNDLDNIQHLSLTDMTSSEDNLILLKKCTRSLKYLYLQNVSLNVDEKHDLLMENLETLIIEESPELEATLPSLLSKFAPTLKCLTLNKLSCKSLASLNVEMCSLEKITIIRSDNLKGLENLLNKSSRLQHLKVQRFQSFVEAGNMRLNLYNVKRLTLKNNGFTFNHQLILACRDNLECLDIGFLFTSALKHLLSSEWFLPKLKVLKLHEPQFFSNEDRSNLGNHIPPGAEVEYLAF